MLYKLFRDFAVFLSLLSAILVCNTVYAIPATTLKITGNGQNGVINTAYQKIAKDFELIYPNIKIKVQLQSDRAFKRNLNHILSKESDFDIVIMHAGERLNQAVANKNLLPITDIWNDRRLADNFTPAMQRVVTHNNDIYAVPFSYYLWGFYYKKPFFEQHNLSVPTNWEQFLTLLKTVKSKGVDPIFIGTKNPWPIGNWFEYLNLRLNGATFHNRFVNGQISGHNEKIAMVLSYLKSLIDAKYFNAVHKTKTLTGGLPMLHREKTAVILAGSGYENFLPDFVRKDIGFFEFPVINTHQAKVQVSPIDVIAVSAHSKSPMAAKEFIAFMADKDVQTVHNFAIKQLPVNVKSNTVTEGTSKTALDILKDADGLTLFYDREVEKTFGLQNLAIWKNFLDSPNIKQAQNQMEQARQEYLDRICAKTPCTN